MCSELCHYLVLEHFLTQKETHVHWHSAPALSSFCPGGPLSRSVLGGGCGHLLYSARKMPRQGQRPFVPSAPQVSTSSLRQGLRWVQSQPPDVDSFLVVLPSQDGHQTCRKPDFCQVAAGSRGPPAWLSSAAGGKSEVSPQESLSRV